ncbi:MAG: hypothetical protein O7E54_03785 [Planctomycetota bacterium]|nr:hypothetical protein [Planctomycetota bacterium]
MCAHVDGQEWSGSGRAGNIRAYRVVVDATVRTTVWELQYDKTALRDALAAVVPAIDAWEPVTE